MVVTNKKLKKQTKKQSDQETIEAIQHLNADKAKQSTNQKSK